MCSFLFFLHQVYILCQPLMHLYQLFPISLKEDNISSNDIVAYTYNTYIFLTYILPNEASHICLMYSILWYGIVSLYNCLAPSSVAISDLSLPEPFVRLVYMTNIFVPTYHNFWNLALIFGVQYLVFEPIWLDSPSTSIWCI